MITCSTGSWIYNGNRPYSRELTCGWQSNIIKHSLVAEADKAAVRHGGKLSRESLGDFQSSDERENRDCGRPACDGVHISFKFVLLLGTCSLGAEKWFKIAIDLAANVKILPQRNQKCSFDSGT